MDQNELTINRNDLYSIIQQYCGDDYAIGFHGIDHASKRIPPDQIESIKTNVLENGLYIENGRTLLGTVAFASNYGNSIENQSKKDFINTHKYGYVKEYILVALPKILKNKNDEQIYLGSPTYNHLYPENMRAQGQQLTSLSDSVLPDYTNSRSILNPMFVLGTFSYLDNEQINLKLNPNHISFNNGIVPDDFFESKKQMILKGAALYDIEQLPNTNCSLEQLQENFRHLDECVKFSQSLLKLDDDTYNNLMDKFMTGNLDEAPENLKPLLKSATMDLDDNTKNRLIFEFAELANETIRQLTKEYYNLDISKPEQANLQAGKSDYKEVAENSIEEKSAVFADIKSALQERETPDKNYDEQGE